MKINHFIKAIILLLTVTIAFGFTRCSNGFEAAKFPLMTLIPPYQADLLLSKMNFYLSLTNDLETKQ